MLQIPAGFDLILHDYNLGVKLLLELLAAAADQGGALILAMLYLLLLVSIGHQDLVERAMIDSIIVVVVSPG